MRALTLLSVLLFVLVCLFGCRSADGEAPPSASAHTAGGTARDDPMTKLRTGRGVVGADESGRVFTETSSICVVDVDSLETQVLSPSRDGSQEGPARWSPDGQDIAFLSDRGGSRHIYLMNTDGSEQRQLTTEGVGDLWPDYSPDGAHVAYSRRQEPDDGGRLLNFEICIVPGVGGRQVELTRHPARDMAPFWSSDGERIAFVTERNNSKDIYVVSRDGTGLTEVTSLPSDDLGPRWSPDGSRLAFMTERDGNWEVYLVELSSGRLTRLTNRLEKDTPIGWSQDGQMVFVLSYHDGSVKLEALPVTGRTPFVLAQFQGHDHCCYLSPDRACIVFCTGTVDDGGLGIAYTDGSGDVALDVDLDGVPVPTSWSPDSRKLLLHVSHRVYED